MRRPRPQGRGPTVTDRDARLCTWYSFVRRLRLGTACVAAHTPFGGCDPPAVSLGFRVCVLNAAAGGLRLRMRARRGLRLGVRPRPVGPAVCCHGYYLLCQVTSSTLTPSSQDKVRSMISGRVAVAAGEACFDQAKAQQVVGYAVLDTRPMNVAVVRPITICHHFVIDLHHLHLWQAVKRLPTWPAAAGSHAPLGIVVE